MEQDEERKKALKRKRAESVNRGRAIDIEKDKMRAEDLQEMMIEALYAARGVASDAARMVAGKDWQNLRRYHGLWLANNPEYAERVKEVKESVIDIVENKMFQLINGVSVEGKDGEIYGKEPNGGMIQFYLRNKARNRGYIEKTESEQTVKSEVTVQIGGE